MFWLIKTRSLVVALLLTTSLSALAQTALKPVDLIEITPEQSPAADPLRWMEEVNGTRALSWVNEQNGVTRERLKAHPYFEPDRSAILSLLNDPARLPAVNRIGSHVYHLLRDSRYKVGLWRRTTLVEYAKKDPQWEPVLDLDALAKAENENWVWNAAICMRPFNGRCMIALSRGGADARVFREFDLNRKRFIEEGFLVPEAKTWLEWLDEDTLVISSGAFVKTHHETLTASGYPRFVKLWRRATPLAAARTVFEAPDNDVSAWFIVDKQVRGTQLYLGKSPNFHTREYSVATANPAVWLTNALANASNNPALTVKPIAIPSNVVVTPHGDWSFLELRNHWQVEKTQFKQGSLLAVRTKDLLAQAPLSPDKIQIIFEPTATRFLPRLNAVSFFQDGFLLTVQDNVVDKLEQWRLDPQQQKWLRASVATPSPGSLSVVSLADLTQSSRTDLFANQYLLYYTDFLTPNQVHLGRFGSGERQLLKEDPQFFNAAGMQARQAFATSKDGTKVPYFIVEPASGGQSLKDVPTAVGSANPLKVPRPVLLNAYGGYQISQKPFYSGARGKAWLERGGVLVVANIRGGGEFGPAWHQAAVKEKRQNSYDDFIAVAEHLVATGVTTPAQLGIQGGSHGGLLVASVMLQRPDLFGAVVCQVPVLDMRNYHTLLAGNSWVAEYGNPDLPNEWAYIGKYSPYHNVKPAQTYPRTLFVTSTRDDRVHPAHARKMAYLMQNHLRAVGNRSVDQVLYFENTEGGHSAAANNDQRAELIALEMSFLWQTLSPARSSSQTAVVSPVKTLPTHENPVMTSLAPSVVSHSVAATPPDSDPFAYMEEVMGEKALSWVRQQNAISMKLLEATPNFKSDQRQILDVLNNKDRIQAVSRRGEYFYNLLLDSQYKVGLWRRTSLSEYKKKEPKWETILDLDQLAKTEKENWVWGGAVCNPPNYSRCLLSLSRGGADAKVVREFDLTTRQFVVGGFELPEAKSSVAWVDDNTVLVSTDFGKDTMTASGYPRQVKLWRRGTSIAQAQLVYEAKTEDVAVIDTVKREPNLTRIIVGRAIDFYRSELFLASLTAQGLGPVSLQKIDVPDDASLTLSGSWAYVELRSDLQQGSTIFKSGSLLVSDAQALLAGKPNYKSLFTPTSTSSLAEGGLSLTRDGVVLTILDNVAGRLEEWRMVQGQWTKRAVNAPTPGDLSVQVLHDPFVMNDPHANDYFLTYTDFLTPTSLLLGQLGSDKRALIKQNPQFFDATGMKSEQRFAVSKDKTRIPYFVVYPKDFAFGKHTAPTLLYGYGGFQVSLSPWYSGTWGRTWLSRGGVFVVANIRGGGEFGPQWHQAAIKANKQKSYDDFAAVAQDLTQAGITTPAQLGIMGGSNGGLLVGAAMTQRPELYGAVVSQVPLLDMKAYHKLLAGNSWMAEYGDPDKPEDWAVIRQYSPYHNVRAGQRYPRVLFATSTRDDRVHPAHARKMAALMMSQGRGTDQVLYYENIEGGHGGAANNEQRAYLGALEMNFLWETLGQPRR